MPLLVAGVLIALPAVAIEEPLSVDPDVDPPSELTGSNLQNADVDTITKTILNIRNWFAGILLIIAVGIILIGAFMYMTSGGDSEKTKKARGWIIGGIIGIVIAAVAFGVFGMVSNIIGDVTGL